MAALVVGAVTVKPVRLTLKNYRCFSENEPLRIEIGPGLIAIVGPNNSGKSALKRFFFEFRPLFALLAHPGEADGIANTFVRNYTPSFAYAGVSDPHEVFNNKNKKSMTIEIEVISPSKDVNANDCLRKIVGTAEYARPQEWRFSTYGTQSAVDLTVSNGAGRPGRKVGHIYALSDRSIDCAEIVAAAAAFRDAKYFGSFRNPINMGEGNYLDLKVGTAFIDLWNDWKTGGIQAEMEAVNRVTEDIRRLFEFDKLEINASLKLKTLIVSINEQPYKLPEIGSGLSQFIMVLGNAATSRPSFVLIDEPESNLHPAIQTDFLLALASYARLGVVFSTHSVGLARSVAHPIYSVQKMPGKTIVRPFEATPNYVEFIGELSFSTFKELGHDRILLVEGVNDVTAAQQLLRLVRKDHTTVVLPLGGDQLVSGEREKELLELFRLSSNICALVDSEREAADKPPKKNHADFAAVCDRIKIKNCLTDRRAIENYFPDRAVKEAFGEMRSAIGPYESLKTANNAWSKTDNWKVARRMRIEELDGTDLGKFLRDL